MKVDLVTLMENLEKLVCYRVKLPLSNNQFWIIKFICLHVKRLLMVHLESDLAQVLLAACKGELNSVALEWAPGSAMVVVMASNGYPGSYVKGTKIQNIDETEMAAPGVKIFHAWIVVDADGNYVANGSRVLGVTAKGKDLEEAQDRVYRAVEEIKWEGGFYRKDIGWRALPLKQKSSKWRRFCFRVCVRARSLPQFWYIYGFK